MNSERCLEEHQLMVTVREDNSSSYAAGGQAAIKLSATISASDGENEKRSSLKSVNCVKRRNQDNEESILLFEGSPEVFSTDTNNNNIADSQLKESDQRRPKAKLRRPIVVALLERWLPPILQLMLIQSILTPILETKCDQESFKQHPQRRFDVIPEFEDQLSAQLGQQKSFDYLVNQQFHTNQQPIMTRSIDDHIHQLASDQLMGAEQILQAPSQEQDSQQQQQLQVDQIMSVDDLLESQSNSAASANAADPLAAGSAPSSSGITVPQPDSKQSGSPSASPSSTSSSSSSSSQATSGLASSTSTVGGNLLTDQLNAVTKLLQQIGGQSVAAVQAAEQQNSALSDAIISGVSNSIIGPIRNQGAAMGNAVRKSIQQQQQLQSANSNRPHNVGQSLDGQLEYDSNNQQLNGFIEFPNFGFNSSSKPSLTSLKPLVWAALKTVPIKLGSVGWKLLQLIAWKKIYKTHHPKSGEIVIEQELGKQHSNSGGKSMGSGGKTHTMGAMGFTGKSLDISSLSADMKQPQKMSKMGQVYSPQSDMFGYARGGFPMHMMAGGAGWAGSGAGAGSFSGFDGSPAMSSSMLYHRHLLPPGVGGGHHHQQQPSAHPATAAAAAAAATAAAIQSQWVHQQQQRDQMLDEQDENSLGRSSNNNNTSSSSSPSAGANALQRKRSSPLAGGNWFATPAHAYAAAAAAANAAATAAAVSQQHQQRFETGGHLSTMFDDLAGAGGGANHQEASFQKALAGLMYQNLFDNAAAMAVQSAVKLPHTGADAMDFLDQSDSLSGSSLSLGSDNSLPMMSGDQDIGWPQTNDHQRSGLQMVNGLSDSLLALSDFAPTSSGNNQNSFAGSSSLSSEPDFDDSPAGKFLGSALNETLATAGPATSTGGG